MSQEQPIDPNRWVDDHGDVLYAYALLRLRDGEAAADVVQETFLDALKGLERFQGRSTERTWLVGILKHKILDRFRQKSRRDLSLDEDGSDFDPGLFFDGRGRWLSRPELPEFAIERAEFWEIFRAALADLPASYAEAFTLSELEGLPGPVICQILGIAPTNLWARLHRARLLLRRALEDRWLGRDPADR